MKKNNLSEKNLTHALWKRRAIFLFCNVIEQKILLSRMSYYLGCHTMNNANFDITMPDSAVHQAKCFNIIGLFVYFPGEPAIFVRLTEPR